MSQPHREAPAQPKECTACTLPLKYSCILITSQEISYQKNHDWTVVFFPISLGQITPNINNLKMFTGLCYLLPEEFEHKIVLMKSLCELRLQSQRTSLASGAFLQSVLMCLSAELSSLLVAGGDFQCPTTRASPKVCQELQTCQLASETNICSRWKSPFLSVNLRRDIISVCCILFLQKESLNSAHIKTVFYISSMGGKSIQEFVYMSFFLKYNQKFAKK